jgi:hypothetical protein
MYRMPFFFDFANLGSWANSGLLWNLTSCIKSCPTPKNLYQEQEQDGEEKDCNKSMICEMKKINLGWVMNPIYMKKKTKRWNPICCEKEEANFILMKSKNLVLKKKRFDERMVGAELVGSTWSLSHPEFSSYKTHTHTHTHTHTQCTMYVVHMRHPLKFFVTYAKACPSATFLFVCTESTTPCQ